MKKYVIYSPHKCGSSILAKILSDIFNFPENIRMNQEKPINNDNGEARLRFVRHIRLQGPDNIDLTKDHIIFIPRNPIGITISMYYSFGFTHPKPPEYTEKQWEESQLDIQKTDLRDYIYEHIKDQVWLIRRCLDWPITNKTVLPYELMVGDFKSFLAQLLKSLDMMSAYDAALEKWESDFQDIPDRSARIVAGEGKWHKRTTDIYEWKSKLSEETQAKLLKWYPFIKRYDDYLKTIL